MSCWYPLRHLLILQVNDHDKSEDEQGILTFRHRWLFIVGKDDLAMYLSNVGNITNALVIVTENKVL